MENDFIWPIDNYKQNINPVVQYIDQASTFLSIQRQIPKERAAEFVKTQLRDPSGKNFTDPEVVFYERNDEWVKELKSDRLSNYLGTALRDGEVIVPTLTTYLNEETHQSLVSVFMKRNATNRGILKKKAQEEEMRGNEEAAYNLNNDQDNAKRNNNSMSGSMAAAGSIFENPTGHNTLTSITRSMSSISNALNERMIAGNRHYMDADAALNNMTAIVNTMDYELVQNAVERYGLVTPTPEQVGEIIYRSAKKYWRDPRHIKNIVEYARNMDAVQRAAVAYTQDLFNLRTYNPEFMRRFIEDFAKPNTSFDIDDPVKYIKGVDPLITNYAHQIFISKLRGKDKDRSKWPAELVMEVAQACATIEQAVKKYKLFIDAFLVVKTLPCETAYINHMSRETVVLSDTDSTMFSVDNWVIWYFDELRFDDYAFAVAGSIMFVSTQLIAHAMAILSANMNVARSKMFVLAMKPEFVFPVFCQTPVAKHYWCSMSVKEGGVFPKNKYEIKGVHLKNSASPAEIVNAAQERMKFVLAEVEAGRKISIYDELKRVSDLERLIIASISKGDPTYLKKMFIKSPTSYTSEPMKSPYRFHVLWNEVFGPSYSEVDAPPYIVLKVPMTTTSRTKMAAWLDSFEDKTLAERYRRYLTREGKTEIKTMYISQDFVQAYGFPKEIMAGIDIKKIILDLTVIDRMVLATLGHYAKIGTLISEEGY